MGNRVAREAKQKRQAKQARERRSRQRKTDTAVSPSQPAKSAPARRAIPAQKNQKKKADANAVTRKCTDVTEPIRHKTMPQNQRELLFRGFTRDVDGLSLCDDVAALVLEYYHSWLQLGDEVDARDSVGKWYAAVITAHKPKGQPLIEAQMDGMNWTKKEISDELEAVYVHYTAWESRWDEWIAVDTSPSGNVCHCRELCRKARSGQFTHRLALPNTQSIFQKNYISLVVDIFNLGIARKDKESPNTPTRHVFHVNKYDEVKVLTALIAQKYETDPHLVMLYQYERDTVIDDDWLLTAVSSRDPVMCYILKDWKYESPVMCKLRQYHPNPSQAGKLNAFGGRLWITFLSIHSARDLHQTVYRRLHAWIGATGNVLAPPPNEEESDVDERWNALLASDALPYRLCYGYVLPPNGPCSLTNAEAPLPCALRDRAQICLDVEWKKSASAALRNAMSECECDDKYIEWMETQSKGK